MPDNTYDHPSLLPRELSAAAPETPDPPARHPPVLRSIAQTATLFDRSTRTIRHWIADGHLRVIRVGRAVFINQDEINRLLRI